MGGAGNCPACKTPEVILKLERLGGSQYTRVQIDKSTGKKYLFPDKSPSVLELPDKFAHYLIDACPNVFRPYDETKSGMDGISDEQMIEELRRRGWWGFRHKEDK